MWFDLVTLTVPLFVFNFVVITGEVVIVVDILFVKGNVVGIDDLVIDNVGDNDVDIVVDILFVNGLVVTTGDGVIVVDILFVNGYVVGIAVLDVV